MSLTKQDLTDIRGVILEALEVVVNPRLDSLEGRFDTLEGRFDVLEERFDTLENKFDKLDGRVGVLESGQRQANLQLASIENKLESIEGQLTALKNDVLELYGMMKPPTELTGKAFTTLSTNDKILALHKGVVGLALHHNVKLPGALVDKS